MTTAAEVERKLLQLSPEGAAVAACEAGIWLSAQLSCGEGAFVASAWPVRRGEFAAGRSCAHRALAAIGADVQTIGVGRGRQPIWPRGVTGSISHAAGLAAAVVATRTSSLAALGIDLELVDGLDPALWPHVLTPAERSRCEAARDPLSAAMTVFSAKEAAFKAMYPVLGVEVDFLEANADIDAVTGTIEVPSVGMTAAIHHGQAGALVMAVAVVAAR